jgi:Peptidase family M28
LALNDSGGGSPTRSHWWWIRWAVLLVGFGIAVLPLVPPAPAGEETDLGEFSADRAFDHVEAIAQSPHPIGSEESRRVQAYLIETLSGMGLSPITQSVEVEDYFGAPGGTVDVVNVMVRIEGVDPTGALALVAHYDTVPTTPGANDDSGGVGILIEIARILSTDPPMGNDVILLFTDGEEPAPRFGSTAFVAEHPWFNDVAFVVNLEATGSTGPSLLVEISGSERQMIEVLSESASHPAAYSFVTEIADLAGGFGTDFDLFKENGVQGISFAHAHGSPIYHTENDSISNVSLASLQQQGANTLAVARTVGSSDLEEQTEPEGAVFFTVVGSNVITYSDAFAQAVSLVAVMGLGTALVFNRGGGLGEVKRVLTSAAFVLGLFVAAIVLGALLWTGLVGWRSTPGIVEAYAYLTLLLGFVVAVWVLATRLFRNRFDGPDLLGGVVMIWVFMAVITTWFAPGTSYLFVWPALVGLVFWLASPIEGGSIISLSVTALIVASIVFIVTLPALDIFFQMAQPRPGNPDSELIPLAGGVTGLWLLIVALIHSVTTVASNESRT